MGIKLFYFYVLCSVFLFSTFIISYAGDSCIGGYVYTNNVPVSGAEVVLVSPSGERKTITEKDGNFLFKGLDPGEYFLKAGKMPTYPFIWWESAEEKYQAKKLILGKNRVIDNIRFNLRPKFLFTFLLRLK